MKRLTFILIVIFLLVACTPKPEQIKPFLDQTLTALPTQTSYPTNTPFSTFTPYPTQTKLPTYTLMPTYTPIIKIITATHTSTPEFTPTETEIPTDTPTMTPTLDPLKEPRGDGFYLVGEEIATGVWRSTSGSDRCYWSITASTGNIIKNHYGMSGGTMYIPSNGFQVELSNCGTWTWLQP